MNPKTTPDTQTRFVVLPVGDQHVHADTLHCNRCGFCTAYCPTYRATGNEALSPRGRNQAFRALLENRLAHPAEAKDLFSSCLLCGACTSVCFAEVPTARLMGQAREKVLDAKPGGWIVKLFLRLLLPRPWLFAFCLRILFLGKRMGVSGVLNRVGFLRWISPALAAAELSMTKPSLRFSRGNVPGFPPNGDSIQFLSCGTNYLRPSAATATAALAKALGATCGTVTHPCCGLLAESMGDGATAKMLAKATIVALEKYPEAVVVVDDSSCAAALKGYPALLEEDKPWQARAQRVAQRTQDLSEWLVTRGCQPTFPSGLAVTFHDPCKARHAQKIVAAPRALLSQTDFRELPEADQCCGGAGVSGFNHAELSEAVLDQKIQCVLSTKAEHVVSSSASCLHQLEVGLRRGKAPVKVHHLAEFLLQFAQNFSTKK